MFTRLRIKLTGIFWIVLFAIGVTGAFAQTVQQVEKIEVTGSNLKRIDTETASPLQIITRADIEKSGKQSLSDVIRSLSADNNGSLSTAFTNAVAKGASGVSLRGLGVNSTLVLLDGRRMAPYGLADDGQRTFVDLSSIPLEAVDRIEVLKDGASAIYGSDAIGGVVNVILKKNYQGVSGKLDYGQSRYGDGKTKTVTLTAGFGDLGSDRYNLFLSLEASRQDAIWQRDRSDRQWIGSGDLRPYGYTIQNGGLAGYFRNSSATANQYVSSSLVGSVRGPSGSTAYRTLPGCTSSISPANNFQPGGQTSGDGGCVWDTAQYNQIQPKEDKLNFLGFLTYAVSPGLQAYAELGLFNSDVTTAITPSQVNVAAWADPSRNRIRSNSGISLSPSHLDNPFTSNARLRYVTGDVGPRTDEYDTTVMRYLVGLKGSLDAWDFDAGLLYSESKTDHTGKGYLKNSVLVQNPALSIAGGTPLLNTNYRIGDDAGLNSQAFYDQLSPTLKNTSKTSVSAVDFKANREFGQLPGGALALALGAELRHEEADNPFVPGTDVGDIVGLNYSTFKSSRTVNAVFAELSMPVLSSLELTAAARTDHYSDYGNSTTPKLGFKWKALETVAVRGTYSTGFRAPGPAENGSGAFSAVAGYVDPVRCNLGAVCASNVLVITTGNSNIKPETSKSFTFGFLLQPIKNTSVAIDYWNITKKSEINSVDPSLLVAYPGLIPNATITRDTDIVNGIPGTGSILAFSGSYYNANKTETNGIDLDVKHQLSLGSYGMLLTNLNWTYINSFKKTFPDGSTLDYAGTHGPTVLSGNAGMPRNRGLLGFSWEREAWTVATNINYISSYSNKESTNGQCLIQLANGTDAPDGCRIASFTTTDFFAKWKMQDNLEFSGSISNLFDKTAPLDPETFNTTGTNYNPTYHLSGAIGRYFRVGLKYSFR